MTTHVFKNGDCVSSVKVFGVEVLLGPVRIETERTSDGWIVRSRMEAEMSILTE